jgi:PKD repeat protein
VLVDQVFEAWLFPDPQSALTDLNYPYTLGDNITEGILNVDITSGNDIYEGPQQQIDTGQFTIVSRNPNLDPKINTNLKYDSTIKFYDTRSGEFFRGFVTDIQVEYQREDNPIITITGTDILGAMQRVVIDQDTHDAIKTLSTGPTWSGITFTEFMPYMIDFTSKYLELDGITPPGYPQPQGFWFPATQSYGEINIDALSYSPAKYIPQVGETYLDVVTKYAQTNLTSFNPKSGFGGAIDFNFIGVTPFPKYNSNFWLPQSDPMTTYTTYDFSSDPTDDAPYQSILLDNGYNRVTNQIDISNESRYVDAGEVKSDTLNFTRTSAESIENYAISAASVSTIFPSDNALPEEDWATNYASNIFQVVEFPAQEIKQITFDNARTQMIEDDVTYSDYSLDKIIRIKHQINQNETIDRVYDIAGINHNISPDNWEMTFTLKPSQQEIVFYGQGSLPTLQMNATSGDSNFNFTATVQNIEPSNVNRVVWALSAIDGNEIVEIWPYAVGGYMFKNGLPRTGLTQTWNFDDDGILEPYSFDPDSTPYDILDNRYGGYGVGYWNVYAFIELTNGFWIVLQQQLTVGTPSVEADFGWVQNLTSDYGQVSFTDTSVNHETGEPDSYVWDFGDGTTSTQRNPIKTYNPAPGQTTYTVSLTVFAYGEGGAKVYDTHTETVTLVQPVMNPNFITFITDGTVQFTNTSTNVGFAEPDAWFWDFDDGTTSTLRDPLKTYSGTQGETISFDVTLTTRNIWEQTASVTKTVTVTPSFTTGSFGVQWIRLRPAAPGSLPTGTRFTPYMYFFKGISSNGNANLLNNKSMELEMSLNQNWYNASGALFASGSSFEVNTQNITRDPSITPLAGYGASGVTTNTNSTFWNFNTTFSPSIYTFKDFSLNFRDVTIANTTQWQTVYLDVWNPDSGWVQIGFFPTGKGPVGKNNTLGANSITEATRTLVKNKVLPLNNFNFTYSFSGNNYTATFTPLVSGPYLWTFPGGVTSTATNPTFTFPNRGIHYVSLQAAGGTKVEQINVLPVFPYNFRYIRIKQKLHDGTHQWDTPFIANLKVQTESGTYVSPGGLTNPQSICSKRITQGTAWSPSYTGATTFDPLNSQNLTNSTGLRFSTTNAGNISEWDVVIDYKEAVSQRIHDITLDAAVPVVSGFAPTIGAGITYEIFTTSYTGTFASATNPDNIGGGATWTKLGEIKPDGMLQNKLTEFSLIPS